MNVTINGVELETVDKETVREYWQRICNTPKQDNPLVNNSGYKDEKLNAKSGGDKFALSPADNAPHVRHCDVPKGCKILIVSLGVVATGHSDGAGEKPNATVKALNDYTEVDQELAYGREVEIDGLTIPENKLSQFRVRITEPFPVSFPYPAGTSIFNSAPGNCEAVADGIYLIYRTSGKKTGKPGQHRIRFKGNIGISDDKDSIDPIGYTEDVTYTLDEKDTL